MQAIVLANAPQAAGPENNPWAWQQSWHSVNLFQARGVSYYQVRRPDGPMTGAQMPKHGKARCVLA